MITFRNNRLIIDYGGNEPIVIRCHLSAMVIFMVLAGIISYSLLLGSTVGFEMRSEEQLPDKCKRDISTFAEFILVIICFCCSIFSCMRAFIDRSFKGIMLLSYVWWALNKIGEIFNIKLCWSLYERVVLVFFPINRFIIEFIEHGFVGALLGALLLMLGLIKFS